MVYSGLEFGLYFEMKGQPMCSSYFSALTPIARMVLCIIQMQFIFLNTTELDLARHKVVARFGLMHMVATNLCEWLHVLVEETKHEIFHLTHHVDKHSPIPSATNLTNPLANVVKNVTSSTLDAVATTMASLHDTNASDIRNVAKRSIDECHRTSIMGEWRLEKQVVSNLVKPKSPYRVIGPECITVPLPVHHRIFTDLCRDPVRNVEESKDHPGYWKESQELCKTTY